MVQVTLRHCRYEVAYPAGHGRHIVEPPVRQVPQVDRHDELAQRSVPVPEVQGLHGDCVALALT